jgi:FdrA protein
MIDPVLRNERLELEMHDSWAGLLLFDLILGYGSHDDPASILAEAVQRARESARIKDRKIVAVASITGTPLDPQGYDRERRYLEDAGIVVMPDNFRAASLVAAILRRVV